MKLEVMTSVVDVAGSLDIDMVSGSKLAFDCDLTSEPDVVV